VKDRRAAKDRRTSKDRPTEDRHTKDGRAVKNRPTKDRQTKDRQTKVRRAAKDRPTEDRQTEDRQTKDRQTKVRRAAKDRPTEDRPTEDRPTEDRPTEDSPTEDRPTGYRPTGYRPTEDRQTGHRPTEDCPTADRRRAERLLALWMGRCHIQNEPSDLWRECAINDVSTLGMGIDLCHPDPIELLGLWEDGELRLHPSRRITVRLELGPSVEITVAGEVRNAGSEPDGMVRAGIEFIGLTGSERSIVRYLHRRASRGSQPIDAPEALSHR
jgi:hypothetical protein